MKNFNLLVAVLFGPNVALAACDDRGRQQSTRTSGTSSASKESDSELQKAVRAKLETDVELKETNLSANADAARNEVTLSGTVRTRAARDRAIELAKRAKRGVSVNDQMDVKPGA